MASLGARVGVCVSSQLSSQWVVINPMFNGCFSLRERQSGCVQRLQLCSSAQKLLVFAGCLLLLTMPPSCDGSEMHGKWKR